MLQAAGAEVVFASCKTEDDVILVAREADAILNTYVRISRRIIESFTRCRIIARYGVGVEAVAVLDKPVHSNGIVLIALDDLRPEPVCRSAIVLGGLVMRQADRARQEYKKFFEAARAPGILDEKTKELIHIALVLAYHCEP